MRKRGRGAIIAVCLIAIVVFGVIYGAWSTLTTVFEGSAPNGTGQVVLVVQNGETAAQIADDLYRKGLVRNPLAFRIWARIKGLDSQLQAGAYILTPPLTIDQIVAKLLNGQPDGKHLAVIDGFRLEQIAAQASTIGLSGFSVKDFLNYTHHPEQFPDRAKYPILQHAPSMEGLLYPDTYVIPLNDNTVQVIDMMLNEFQQAVQESNLVALAKQHQLSEYQMVILASIVQREASNAGQMPLIAGIYWKRVYQPSPEIGGAYLQSDPTVEYAYDTDHPPVLPARYWVDLNNRGRGDTVDPASPWNTYTHAGWPVTPIASPNLTALKAAASPVQTNCYYFLTKPKDGSLACAPTYAEFQQLVQQYLSH